MKLLFIFMTACLMQVSASSYAQRITLTKKNASLISIFDQINRQSGLNFLVTNELLKGAKPVDINVKDEEVREVLDKVFKNQPLSYTIEDNAVIVSRKTPSFLDNALVIQSFAKDLIVRGKILDESGKPLEGATVVLKGTSRTAKTDAKGEFVIPNVPDDAVLVIRYVGYRQLEIPLKDAVMPLEIKLNVATGELEEVKVVYNTGYQELNKERATGSFVQIDNELFNRAVGSTVLDRISYVTSGLLQRRSLASPLNDVVIRGVSTINANKQPLLVVDNFIYDGDPNELNPNDIESVTILKDAAAASIWGVRAGNGVIVITTKKGKFNQKPNISFTSNLTINEKRDLYYISSIPSKDIIALEKQRFNNNFYDSSLSNTTSYPVLSPVVELLALKRSGKISEAEANQQISVLENHDIRNDINKYLYKNSINQQYALNLSGGSETYKYYTSVGYDQQKPNEVNIKNDRLTLRYNNTWKPFKNLELSSEINWSRSRVINENSLGGSSITSLLTNPYLRLADNDGNALVIPRLYRQTYVDSIKYKGLLDWHYRPLDEAENGNQRSQNYVTRIAGGIKYKLFDGLNIDLSYQWQKVLFENKTIASINTFATRDLINRFVSFNATTKQPIYPYPLGDAFSESNSSQSSWNMRGQIAYNKNWAEHNVSAIAGFETREIISESLNIPTQYGYNPQTNTFQVIQFGAWQARPSGSTQTLVPATILSQGIINRFGSYYANAAYTFRNKYTLSGSGRVDQSNFFGVNANDRKVPLWSAGFSWDIGKEKFYSFNWLPYLKLRGTYGYNGNTTPGNTPFATASYSGPNAPLFTPFATLVTSPNPELRWERVRNINIGLDFNTKQQRFGGSIELYQKKGLDLIGQITVDPTSGFSTYTGNNSSTKANGIDFTLNSSNLQGFIKWNTSFLFSYNKEKVTNYSAAPPANGLSMISGAIMTGKPLNNLYSYQWAGLDPATGGALMYINKQIQSSSNFTKSKPEDMLYNGGTIPSIFGAIRNDFLWKELSISINIIYRFGYYFRRPTFSGSFSSGNMWNHSDYLKAWKNPGDELKTSVPAFAESYPDSRYAVYQSADILIEKGDHIRLQDIRLNYSFNMSSIKRVFIKNASLFLYASNLGILWRANSYKIDPDATTVNSTPMPRRISIGANLNF